MARCKYGKLKNPTKHRRCRKRPARGRGKRSPIKGKCCKRYRRNGPRRCASFGKC